MEIFIRADEGCAAQPLLLWDTVWDNGPFAGTWALAGQQPGNVGGLQATAALDTAVILALFTDKRCPPDHPLAKYVDPADLRGWWGDGVDVRADLGETELGSLLWCLERTTATPDIAQWAQALALDALAPLVGQGAVANVTAAAGVLTLPSEGIWLRPNLYARDGSTIYDRRFEAVWNQVLPTP